MIHEEKYFEQCSAEDIKKAKIRYLNALKVSIKGTGSVFIKREPRDIFNLMLVHDANHDVQLVVDQCAWAKYICEYLTKTKMV